MTGGVVWLRTAAFAVLQTRRVQRSAWAMGWVLLLAGCALTPRPGDDGESGLQWLSGDGPRYPPKAKAEGIEGCVVLEYTVGADGRVGDPRVVSAQPAGVFNSVALAAIRSWRYRPVHEDGEPVPVAGVRSTLRFRLDDDRAAQY